MKPFFITTIALVLVALFAIGCSLQPAPSVPGLLVTAPPSASVYTVGETVAVQSTSTDPNNIVRVTLLVDGVIVREDSSPVATGQQQFSVIQTWTADRVGQHNLVVRATNAQGVSTEAGIYVTVQAAPAASPAQPTLLIPSATAPAATAALPPAPTAFATPTNPAITVIITATPQNTATPTPTVPVVATATGTLAPKTAVPASIQSGATPTAPTTAAPVPPTATATNTAVAPTTAPPLPNAAVCSGQPAAFTFSASKTTLTAGQSVTLTWGAINNASLAVLNGGVFAGQGVAAPGTITASPTSTTTYTLTATCNNGGGTRVASVTVTVSAAVAPPPPAGACSGTPQFTSFSITPTTLIMGQTATVSWVTTNADAVTIKLNDLQDAPAALSESQNFELHKTGTVTVTARCSVSGTQAVKSGTITVIPAACSQLVINSLTASASSVAAGDSVTLAWSTTNADSVLLGDIESFPDAVNPSGTRTISLLKTTTFNLQAMCSATGRIVTSQVTVTVTGGSCSGVPKITSFTADKNPANVGDTVTLSWGLVTNADKVVIAFVSEGMPLRKEVTVPGSTQFKIPTSARGQQLGFTLEATCSTNTTGSSARVIINVNP